MGARQRPQETVCADCRDRRDPHPAHPCRASAEAEQFVRAHRDWLLTKRRERERTRPLSPVRQLADGEVFRYLGRTYRLAVSGEEGAAAGVRLVAGHLVMGSDLAAEPQAGRAPRG
ncbi:YgjP-like metallopeptidase domain-containing protein [Streptomyces sp. NPDC050997]|uniref:YgjP-like metallopeptidase domain-containing protein n=1 Tax=Streptomyces sp. NPDC050997 TaxID=3155519 RepID=UPI003445F40F